MPSLLESLHVVRFGREYLLKALGACGDAGLDFRPAAVFPVDKGARPLYSLREHFLHVADIGEMFIFEGVLGSEMPAERYRLQHREDGTWFLRQPWPDAASVQAELEISWAFQDEHLFSRPHEDLAARVGREGRSLVADEIGWLIFHESQHRGQILTGLRLAGLEPPEW
jgi:uncharacterized damage-inducible protein DinB